MFTRTTRAKRNIATVALAALVGSLLALSTPAGALDATAASTERISGENRYATAAAIALDTRWDTMTNVDIVVVNGDSFADGLAAAALNRRILLTRADSIPTETADAITTLAGPTIDINSVTVVGGTGVVSSAVLEELGTLAGVDSVTRLAGADRYETALAVAKSDTETPADDHVVLATGANFPDALAAGPFAIERSATIVLNDGASLRADVKAYLSSITTGIIYVIGGEGAVPASVVSEINSMGKTVERISGATREATAVAVADKAALLTLEVEHSAVLVNRDGFADALGAGPFAAQADIEGSIMLVGADSVSADTAGWHEASCQNLGGQVSAGGATDPDGKIFAIGGTAVISDSVLATAGAASKCPDVTLTATVTNSAYAQATYEVEQNAGGGPASGSGPTLTAVAGSIVDGAAGNDWTITITDAADGTATSATVDSIGRTLAFNIAIPAAGLSQADFVAAWNGLGTTSALFTAAEEPVVGNTGFADGSNPTVAKNATPVDGSQTQTIVVTFSEAVDNGAGATLAATDLTFGKAVTAAMASPLAGTTGGATVYTLVISQSDPDLVLVAGTDTVAAGANVDSVLTDKAASTTAVKLTAGS